MLLRKRHGFPDQRFAQMQIELSQLHSFLLASESLVGFEIYFFLSDYFSFLWRHGLVGSLDYLESLGGRLL